MKDLILNEDEEYLKKLESERVLEDSGLPIVGEE